MTTNERWLIVGCGYLGAELARRALLRGVRVGVLTRNREQASMLRQMGCDPVIEGDLAEREWLNQTGGEYHALINCVSGGGGGIEGYRRSYVEGQKRVGEWMAQYRPKRAVYTSSTSVYSQVEGEVVDEATPLQELSPAGQLLLEGEQLFQHACEQAVTSHYVFRLTAIYGPGRHHLLDAVRSGTQTLAGDGSIWLNLIHRDDACCAIERVLDPALPVVPCGVYNLSDGVSVTRQQFVEWLAERIDRPPPHYDPNLISQRIQRRRRSDGRTPHRRISAQRFRSLSGWRPRFVDFKSGYTALLS